MKNTFYIIAALLLLATSCTSTKEASSTRQEREMAKSLMVEQAVKSGMYVIKVERLYGRGGFSVDMRPSHNYIVINHDMARINLGYMGRSYDIRQIAGINLTGRIIEKEVTSKDKGRFDINMKVKENNDVFTLNIFVGRDGYCDVGVIHPRIDHVNYRGQIKKLN